jgi:hypothetical protein
LATYVHTSAIFIKQSKENNSPISKIRLIWSPCLSHYLILTYVKGTTLGEIRLLKYINK